MSHRIEAQVSHPPRRHRRVSAPDGLEQVLSDKQDNSERLPNDPVLKVKNTKPGKREETKKREQLIAPFHEGDVGAQSSALSTRKNRLVDRSQSSAKCATYGWPSHAHYS